MNNMVEYELGLMQILTNVLAAENSSEANQKLANEFLHETLTDIRESIKQAKTLKKTDIQIVQEIS